MAVSLRHKPRRLAGEGAIHFVGLASLRVVQSPRYLTRGAQKTKDNGQKQAENAVFTRQNRIFNGVRLNTAISHGKTEYFKHRIVDFRLTVLFSCNETERTDNMNDKFFIQKLKEKREKYGISQSRFAVACGISREHYNRIENGKTPLTEELKQEITKQLERFNPQEPLFLLIDYFRVRFPTTDAENVIKDVSN